MKLTTEAPWRESEVYRNNFDLDIGGYTATAAPLSNHPNAPWAWQVRFHKALQNNGEASLLSDAQFAAEQAIRRHNARTTASSKDLPESNIPDDIRRQIVTELTISKEAVERQLENTEDALTSAASELNQLKSIQLELFQRIDRLDQSIAELR